MKTYAECEQEVAAKVARVKEFAGKIDPECPIAFECGVLQALAVDYLYQVECLRDKSNTEEMHALYERLGGQ